MKKILFACLIPLVLAQAQPTPYDLIRPTWPVTWDPTIFDTYVPNPKKANPIPLNRTPATYAPNDYIPDTLNQAYLDAMNLKIGRIRINQAGYLTDDTEKQFYYVGSATSFSVVDLNGQEVGTGTFRSSGQSTASSWKIIAGTDAATNDQIRYTVSTTGPSGTIMVGNLPSSLPTDQRLRVKVGNELSADFIISDRVYSMVRDATLKFMGINRSGNSESWFHPASHTKDGAGTVVDNGGTAVTGVPSAEGQHTGGWYDCGDHLKESQTQAYAFMVLSVLAATNPGRDEDHYAYNHSEAVNTDGIPDMLREARHGADFAINAYDVAGGVIDNMALSVGNFGADHGWWGRPENQDFIPVENPSKRRGGPQDRDIRLGELGSNISGQFAAGLALVSKEYQQRDPVYSAKALKVAEEMYDFAKSLMQGKTTYGTGLPFVYNKKPAGWSTPAYNGNNEAYDDLALAAVSLFYATKDPKYLNDAAESTTLGVAAPAQQFWQGVAAGPFNGGWFVTENKGFLKNGKNTSWANAYAYALYAFYKLILRTDAQAAEYGITSAKRLEYIEDVAYNMTANLGDIATGAGSGSIVLPAGDIGWKPTTINFDPIWYSMFTDGTWIYNRYQSGNIFEVLAYADVTKDLEGLALPVKGVKNWMSKEMRQLGLRQLDYMLGVNPWDVSFLLGVGDKNDAHPHHRGANPEGKNVPGAPYKYRPPTGALFGGVRPDAINAWAPANKSWEDYHLSETCIDATATFIASGTIASKETDRFRAPEVQVQIKYVGFDSTIVVVRQSFPGSTVIHYGTTPTGFTDSATTTVDGVLHTMVLKPLKNGTTYYFTATSENGLSGNATVKFLVDSTQTPFTFTTLNSPPAAADIQNVKVCNVHADSAEIMWYTPNGDYESKIYWDTVLTSYDKMRWSKTGDVAGVPTKFHYMKIGGLQEKTTYYFAVESNGQVRAVGEDGSPLKFTTPVTQYDFEVRTYQYQWGGMSMMNINIFNNEARPYDSLTVRLYMRGTEAIAKDIGIRMDICQAYDEAGFNKACDPATITYLTTLLRLALPTKIDDTYDPNDGTWQWYFPVPLGSTVIKSSSRFRMDVGFDKRSPWPPYLDLMNEAPLKKLYCQVGGTNWYSPDGPNANPIGANPGDWTWQPHSKVNDDPVDYAGLPCVSKDQGDMDFQAAAVNPYVTVYRKDEFVWGYSPSYSEMITKRANYKLTTKLNAPFNVSNGSYVQLDQTSSTLHVKGQAHVTEGGVINSIWVNGVKLTDLTGVATYVPATDMWDLDIPVKLGIGANKVDVTVFAGPDLACVPCQENGGCAFVNHNFFIQFSRPGLTKSSLTIQDVNTLVAVASPAVPGQTIFNVTVSDLDKMKGKPATLDVLVINSRKQDTLVVKLGLVGDVYTTSAPISAVSKDAAQTTGNEIAFFGGDTIYIRYVDPDDEEDISEQSFFAQPTFPMPVAATAKDNNCDGITDAVDILFAQPFGAGDRIDSIWIAVRDPASSTPSDSFAVTYTGAVEGLATITVALPVRTTLPVTGSPAGSVVVRVVPAIGLPEQATVALSDGIPPLFTVATMLENIGHASARDTLKLSFSERVVLPSRSSWPLLVTQGGTLVNTASLVVVGEATTEDDGKSWLYVVEGNDGGQTLAAGYVTQVRDDFAISDLARNPLFPDSLCQEPVTIVEVPKPVPLTFAEMRDRDGDGSADEVYMKFERKLRDKDMLDSFVVGWAKPEVLKSFLPVTPRTWILGVDTSSHPERVINGTDTNIVIVQDTASTLSLTFLDSTLYAYGATQGALNGNGSVTPRLGPAGGFFDRSYTLTDKVGPVVVSARKGSRGADDTLAIVVSEPVDSLNRNLILERRRGGAVTSFAPKSVLMSLTGVYFNFEFNPEANDAIRVGDFVRLVPTGAGVKDKSGNAAGMNNPWVEVRGAISSDVKFKLDVVKNVTGGKAEVIRAGYLEDEPDSKTHFRVTLFYPDSSRERKLQDLNNGTPSEIPDAKFYGVGYTHLGPTFLADLELPGATIVREVNGDTTFVWNYVLDLKLTIFDNLGQFVNAVDYKLDLKELHISTKCAEIMNIQEDLSRSTCQQLVSAGRIDTTKGVDRSFIGADGKMRLRFEWMVHNGAAPKSLNGRVVGTGPYIGVFDLTAKSIAQVDDVVAKDPSGNPIGKPKFEKGDVEKTKANKRRTFGLIRAE